VLNGHNIDIRRCPVDHDGNRVPFVEVKFRWRRAGIPADVDDAGYRVREADLADALLIAGSERDCRYCTVCNSTDGLELRWQQAHDEIGRREIALGDPHVCPERRAGLDVRGTKQYVHGITVTIQAGVIDRGADQINPLGEVLHFDSHLDLLTRLDAEVTWRDF
jgi:hypothetical protein